MKNIAELADSASEARGQTPTVRPLGDASARPSAQPDRADRPHILYVIDELCEMGGAERVLLNMIRLLPRERFRCSLVTFKIEPSLRIFENFPCPWHLFPMRRTYDWNALRVANQIRRLIRSQRVRIVHTFFETSDLWGGLVAKLSGQPVLVSSRRDMGILRRPIHDRAYRLLNPMFDLVLTVSEEVRTFCMRQDHLAPEKVATLHNGIEIDKAATATDSAALRAQLKLSGASHIICAVAHIRRVEAMACSLPCVATRVGGNAEALQDGQNGFLVEPEDASATADRILTLLRRPEWARRMGHAARQAVEEKFTQEAMMKNLVGVYERLLAAKQR